MRSGLPVPTHAVRALYGSTAVPRLGQGTATPHNRNYVGCGVIMGHWGTSVHWHTPVGGGETEDDLDPQSYRPVSERDLPQVRALRKNGGYSQPSITSPPYTGRAGRGPSTMVVPVYS